MDEVPTSVGDAGHRRCDVAVLGSANLDIVLRVASLPRPGETLLAHGRSTGAGGKGSNQAIAAARAGASVSFLGGLGRDGAADVLREELRDAGVDITAVRATTAATGTAYVIVDDHGENEIIVDAGANGELHDLLSVERDVVAGATVLLCQLEVPIAIVSAAVEHAHALGVLTIVNAAPAAALPVELARHVDVLIVNEGEALAVAGSAGSVDAAVGVLSGRFAEVVVTLGAAGAMAAVQGKDVITVAGVPARQVVDTTGAGDTFCGSYAAARSRGEDPVSAATWACAAASLSVERAGAAASAPSAAEVRDRLSTSPDQTE